MEVKETTWVAMGVNCKGADQGVQQSAEVQLRGGMCGPQAQEESCNGENVCTTNDSGDSRKSSNFFRREEEVWFLDMLVDLLTEHLGRLVYHLVTGIWNS